MKAISLWQPHASLMAAQFKRIETRGRITHVRGMVAIHAANRSFPYHELSAPLRNLIKNHFGFTDQGRDLPHGSIISVGELYECWTTEWLTSLRHPLSNIELMCGNYSAGRFGWAFKDIVKLEEPVPCKGHQGWFHLPPDVEAKVRAQL